MSHSQNENEFYLDLEKKLNESFSNCVNVDYQKLIQTNPQLSSQKDAYLFELESENKSLREKNLLLMEANQNLKTELTVQDLNIKKNEEKVNILLQENFRLKSAIESYEEVKTKLTQYEKLDLPGLFRSSPNEQQIITGFMEKLKIIDADYQRETSELKRIITQLRMQIDYLNSNNNHNKYHSYNTSVSRDLSLLKEKEEELVQLRNKVSKAESDVESKDRVISKLLLSLDDVRSELSKITAENSSLRLSVQNLTTNNSSNNNNMDNSMISTNHSECVKSSVHQELKTKLYDFLKTHEALKEELEAEKSKYVSLLEMNQDLGKKIIENLKVMNENKSEISYLKRKVAEQQKEKGGDQFDDISSNFELDLYHEDKKKANEIRLGLEKQVQEQKIQIAELTQTIKDNEMRIQSLVEELNLEKMENENLKEIQKSDLKNISKMLSEQSSLNQAKKNEEYVNELKISLQNTNKINQELANQKKDLEKEISELKNKIKEQQSAFLFLSNERDPMNPSVFRDDKSQAAFSRFSMASNLTQNKFLDTKIKDLEDSLIQEKENTDNLLKIKQSLIDKLKKSNDSLIAERNKINKELSEEKMKNKTLQMEKNTLLESEEYLKAQVQELNAEVCDLRIYQENYELIEEKLEEFQRQFSNMVSNYNNPQMQKENLEKLVNENVELNAFKHKYLAIESELQGKNQEICLLKEKCSCLEKDFDLLKQGQADANASNNAKNEELLKELENKIKTLEEENKEINKTIEDNRLIIFSLREKCKDVIAKEKEIFRLNNVINELNLKKKKRVSFGKDIVVEYKKECSPSEQGNEVQREPNNVWNGNYYENNNNNNFNNNNNNGNFNNNYYEVKQNVSSNNYNNINDLLRSQQDLYQKYQNELNNIRRIQPPSIFMELNDVMKTDAFDNKNLNGALETNASENSINYNNSNNNYNNKNNSNQVPISENADDLNRSREEMNKQINDIYKNFSNQNQNAHYSPVQEEQNINIITNADPKANQNAMIPEAFPAHRQGGDNILSALNIPKIEIGNIDILSALESNLDSELSRIKNKYKLNNDGEADNSVNQHVIPNMKDSFDLRNLNKKMNEINNIDSNNKSANKTLNQRNNIPDFMSRSHVSPMSIFDRILQENSISLDGVENKKEDTDDNSNNNEKTKDNLSSSVIVVNSKNQLILKEDFTEQLPISDEVEVKGNEAESKLNNNTENNGEKAENQ